MNSVQDISHLYCITPLLESSKVEHFSCLWTVSPVLLVTFLGLGGCSLFEVFIFVLSWRAFCSMCVTVSIPLGPSYGLYCCSSSSSVSYMWILLALVSYSYNKMNQMHYFLKFIFGIKLYKFRTVPLSITRSFSLHTEQWCKSNRFADSLWSGSWSWYKSFRFADSLRSGSGWNVFLPEPDPGISQTGLLTSCDQDQDGTCSVLILIASCQQTCLTYTIAVCTVRNSWWWTEELSETCRVLFQK